MRVGTKRGARKTVSLRDESGEKPFGLVQLVGLLHVDPPEQSLARFVHVPRERLQRSEGVLVGPDRSLIQIDGAPRLRHLGFAGLVSHERIPGGVVQRATRVAPRRALVPEAGRALEIAHCLHRLGEMAERVRVVGMAGEPLRCFSRDVGPSLEPREDVGPQPVDGS